FRAAATAGYDHIDLLPLASRVQCVEDRLLLADDWKILHHLAAIDRDLAAAGTNSHAGNRLLPPTRPQAITADLVFFGRDHNSSLNSLVVGFALPSLRAPHSDFTSLPTL